MSTTVGDVNVKITTLRHGSFFTSLLGGRRSPLELVLEEAHSERSVEQADAETERRPQAVMAAATPTRRLVNIV